MMHGDVSLRNSLKSRQKEKTPANSLLRKLPEHCHFYNNLSLDRVQTANTHKNTKCILGKFPLEIIGYFYYFLSIITTQILLLRQD